jgi:predicted RNA binding protein YcfA (HicA-like mRNA interferase family)
MSEKLPRVSANKVIKVLERMDFVLARQSGSHKIYKNKEGVRVTVPYHSGKTLHPKILKNILRDADLTVEKFKKLMNKKTS